MMVMMNVSFWQSATRVISNKLVARFIQHYYCSWRGININK